MVETKYSPRQPRDDHGRWTSGGGSLAREAGRVDLGNVSEESPGEGSTWTASQQADVRRAVADAAKRDPHLFHDPVGLWGVGYATGEGHEGARLQFTTDTQLHNFTAYAVNSFRPYYGSKITINDDVPFKELETSAPSARTPYGMVTHEIGHAYFNSHGYYSFRDSLELLLKHGIQPSDLKFSQYGQANPSEALAEMYSMEHTPGFALPEPLGTKYRAIEKELNALNWRR